MIKVINKTMYFTLMFILFGVLFSTPLHVQADNNKDPYEVAVEIINWKKRDVGSTTDEYLINETFLSLAGTTAGDWYPIGLGRFNIEDNQEGYLAVINNYVEERYKTSQKLDKAKATEWHRISLAVIASGGNPRSMGSNKDIDLIADGTYNRVDSNGKGILGKQGINGFIWGLIALDSMFYEIPEDAYYTRDDIILNILNRQLSDGGWALTGNVSDPDITGMVLQSLAPYYNSEKEYQYENKRIEPSGATISKKVRTAINEALEMLSDVQNPDGGFTSWGTANSESCAQVAVALCSLNINLFEDERFIKNEKTIYDAILSYQNEDGGFIHSKEYDPENPSALPDKSNTLATEQVLYCLNAIIRYQNNQRRLYDFREEQDIDLVNRIKEVESLINYINESSSKEELLSVYNSYWLLPALERSYVANYEKLSNLLALQNIPYYEENFEFNSGDAGIIVPMEIFSDEDIKTADSLPKELTTQHKVIVLKLWSKIQNCFDFDNKESYYIKIEKAKNEIELIEKEIESIKSAIKEKLYPFEQIKLSDKETVYELFNRYMALSDYDKQTFENSDVEGLLKCKTHVDNLYLALWISIVCIGVVTIISCIIIIRVSKRKKEKVLQKMPESDE